MSGMTPLGRLCTRVTGNYAASFSAWLSDLRMITEKVRGQRVEKVRKYEVSDVRVTT